MSNSAALTFPDWLPSAVMEAGNELSKGLANEKDRAKAWDVLCRLISDPLMDRVWREIYRKHQATKEYLHPAFTYASRVAAFRQKASDLRKKGGAANEHDAKSLEVEANYLEAEAKVMEGEIDPLAHTRWTRQDRAAQILLWQAYRAALDDEPVFLSSLIVKTNDLRKVVQDLQSGVTVLQSHNLNREARKLNELTEEIEDQADDGDPFLDPQTGRRSGSPRFPHIDDPWVIVRGTPDARMRSFIITLSGTTLRLFGNALLRTLANITNVVFDREDITEGRVRELLRIRSKPRTDQI